MTHSFTMPETSVKIKSPKEKVLREEQENLRSQLARSPPPVRRSCKPAQHVEAPGLIKLLIFTF